MFVFIIFDWNRFFLVFFIGPEFYSILESVGYTVVAFYPESKSIVIYIFSKDGSGKGIVLSINHHDVVS